MVGYQLIISSQRFLFFGPLDHEVLINAGTYLEIFTSITMFQVVRAGFILQRIFIIFWYCSATANLANHLDEHTLFMSVCHELDILDFIHHCCIPLVSRYEFVLKDSFHPQTEKLHSLVLLYFQVRAFVGPNPCSFLDNLEIIQLHHLWRGGVNVDAKFMANLEGIST